MLVKRILIGGAALVVFACSRSSEAPATTTTTGGSVATSDATQQLANARCNREAACGNMGTDKKFLDQGACVKEAGRDARFDLRPELCPKGIDGARLSSCLSDIRGESCGKSLDAIDRISSCRTEKLCIE